jgi:hypothetical protein
MSVNRILVAMERLAWMVIWVTLVLVLLAIRVFSVRPMLMNVLPILAEMAELALMILVCCPFFLPFN